MRGIGDEFPLPGEGVGEAVEHVIEGVGEDAHLVAARAGGGHSRLELAAVDPGRDRGHPPQRRRDAGAGEIRSDQSDR